MQYVIPAYILKRMAVICRTCSSRELARLVKLISQNKGACPPADHTAAKEELNRLYWEKVNLRHGDKAELQALYSELDKMKPESPSAKPSMRDKLEEIRQRQIREKRLSNYSHEHLSDTSATRLANGQTEKVMNVKKELIKLGSTETSLRPHIEKVLSALDGEGTQTKTAKAMPTSLLEARELWMKELVQLVGRNIAGASLRTSAPFEENGTMMFGVLKGRSEYMLDVALMPKNDMLFVKATGNPGKPGISLKISANKPMAAVAKEISQAIGEAV